MHAGGTRSLHVEGESADVGGILRLGLEASSASKSRSGAGFCASA